MIRSTIILCSLIIFGIVSSIQAAPLLHKRFAGQGTFYEVGLGACGKVNNDNELVAALSAPQFGSPPNPNNSPFCGRQVRVNGPSGSVTVTLVDRCEACQFGDLDLSPTAFQQIAPLSAGRVQITWDFCLNRSKDRKISGGNKPLANTEDRINIKGRGALRP
ncbi:7449_t:CDS:2 [Paraglomus brasilianum]|uniref:7449_t:CDS:1 n=1 Tax=Paraglomus brasilianum TaxID=144538 RepID=A0A9N9BZD6_9GLOM|nr:7449_t:CDS:2 [Paraglomus brasilianum]